MGFLTSKDSQMGRRTIEDLARVLSEMVDIVMHQNARTGRYANPCGPRKRAVLMPRVRYCTLSVACRRTGL